MFILLSSVVFFAWGEIFSLFPSLTADLYGRKWATTNYGIVYTAKGTARNIFRSGGCICDAEEWLFGPGVLRNDRLRHHRCSHGIALAEASGGATNASREDYQVRFLSTPSPNPHTYICALSGAELTV